MRVHRSKVKNLSSNTYRKLQRPNFRHNGIMQAGIQWARQQKDNSQVFYLIDEEEIVISWMLLLPLRSERSKTRRVHAYTRKVYRRNGYGQQLLRAVNIFCQRNMIRACNNNAKFFRKTKHKFSLDYISTPKERNHDV